MSYIYNTYQIHVIKAYNFVLDLQTLIKEFITKTGTVRIFEKVSVFFTETSQGRPLSPALLSIFLGSRVQPEHFTKSREPTSQNSKRFHNPPCSKTKQNKNSQNQR